MISNVKRLKIQLASIHCCSHQATRSSLPSTSLLQPTRKEVEAEQFSPHPLTHSWGRGTRGGARARCTSHCSIRLLSPLRERGQRGDKNFPEGDSTPCWRRNQTMSSPVESGPLPIWGWFAIGVGAVLICLLLDRYVNCLRRRARNARGQDLPTPPPASPTPLPPPAHFKVSRRIICCSFGYATTTCSRREEVSTFSAGSHQ
jgi:hypothetical protein